MLLHPKDCYVINNSVPRNQINRAPASEILPPVTSTSRYKDNIDQQNEQRTSTGTYTGNTDQQDEVFTSTSGNIGQEDKIFAETNISLNRILRCHGPSGRLGNAMFDFAVSYGIAHTLNYTYVIRSQYRLLKFFELNQIIVDDVENVMKIPLKKWRDESWRKSELYLSYNLTLRGYYRVWRYFQDVENDVRKAFTIKSYILNTAIEFLSNSTPAVKTLIGVHVRRGDFLSVKSVQKGRIAASGEYISRAMNHFRNLYSDAVFVVLSVDKTWCKENIFGDDVIYSLFKEPIIDLAILSLCDHVILTAGTFGWWGGWLAGGSVVYCKDFPKPGSFLENKILFRNEFYPPEWIGFGNCSLWDIVKFLNIRTPEQLL